MDKLFSYPEIVRDYMIDTATIDREGKHIDCYDPSTHIKDISDNEKK